MAIALSYKDVLGNTQNRPLNPPSHVRQFQSPQLLEQPQALIGVNLLRGPSA